MQPNRNNSSARGSRPTVWLSLAWVILALPLSGAGAGGGQGFLGLLEELLCACATCQDEPESAELPARGCCADELEAPPVSAPECGDATSCCCSSPVELPVRERTPLDRAHASGQDQASVARLRAAQDLAARTPWALESPRTASGLDRAAGAPAEVRARSSERATPPAGDAGTRERLALLCTALI